MRLPYGGWTRSSIRYRDSHVAARRNSDFELTELFTAFDQLEDPGSSINRLHPLSSVLSIAVLAVLCGAEGPTSIRYWAEARQEFLERFIELPNGLPSRDVFRRVLCALQPAAFQQCFSLWIQSMSAAIEAYSNESNQEAEKRHLAIDGKTLKGSRNDSKGIVFWIFWMHERKNVLEFGDQRKGIANVQSYQLYRSAEDCHPAGAPRRECACLGGLQKARYQRRELLQLAKNPLRGRGCALRAEAKCLQRPSPGSCGCEAGAGT